MAYIGKQPVVGNFQKCDAISVVNGQAAYTLNVGGAAVNPENANHMLVSLNGVLQAPGDSFTVSGSTLTFASNLATGDVIDFVIILGDVLDLGTPSDNSISTAKLVANSVTAAKFNADVISGQTELAATPADTDELLISDAGVIKRIDYSYLKSTPGLVHVSTSTITSATSAVEFTSGLDTYNKYKIFLSGVHPATDNQDMQLLYSTDGGSSYLSANYVNAMDSFGSGSDRDDHASGSQSTINLTGAGVGTSATESFNAEITLYQDIGYSGSGNAMRTLVSFKSVYIDLSGNATHATGVGSNTGTTSAIDAIKFKFASGNIAEGVFSLYGIPKG